MLKFSNPPLPCLASPGPIFLSLRPRFLSAPFSAVSAPRARYLAPCCSHLPVRSSTLLQHREAKQEESHRVAARLQRKTRCDSRAHDVASPASESRSRVPLSLLGGESSLPILLSLLTSQLSLHASRSRSLPPVSFLASQPQTGVPYLLVSLLASCPHPCYVI